MDAGLIAPVDTFKAQLSPASTAKACLTGPLPSVYTVAMSSTFLEVMGAAKIAIDELRARAAKDYVWTPASPPVPSEGGESQGFDGAGPGNRRVIVVHFKTAEGEGWDGALVFGATVVRLPTEDAKFVYEIAEKAKVSA